MGKTKAFFEEFRKFISKGNVMDMAVGVIVGAAFKGIIDSLVADIIMPIISLFVGGLDFSNLFIAFDGKSYPTLQAAKNAGVGTLNYGNFITVVINFLLLALVVFIMVKNINKLTSISRKNEEEAEPATKTCPFCKRCPKMPVLYIRA